VAFTYAQADLDLDPPIYTSQVGGMTGTCHHTQLLKNSNLSE
jgi:hypothetical protein